MSTVACPLAECQQPGKAFERTCQATVISCKPVVEEASAQPKKGKQVKGAAADCSSSSSSSSVSSSPLFDVVLSSTVLFPEGGGQPTDTGVLKFGSSVVQVASVLRTPGAIVHRVNAAVAEGTEVRVEVDWSRRFDHMQCHSTQHLISAVARKRNGWKTLSWWLASQPQECHIEMDSVSISEEQMRELESECNEWIRAGTAMKLHTWPSLASARRDELFSANVQKSIPDTHEGAIRVVEIEGLEFNPCCGTHLNNTAQMQSIAITRVEKGKVTKQTRQTKKGETE